MSHIFSSAWLMNREARLNTPAVRRGDAAKPPDAVEREIAGLHHPIIAECKRRGWRYIYSDPTRPATIGEGVCDFIIFADRGRVFLIECKSKTGKLKDEQAIFICWVKKLGHEAHVITAMSEFFAIVDAPHGTSASEGQIV
jgi:VRR-NUC domain